MYLRVSDNVTDEQLEAIAKILQVSEVEFFYNVHYEACRFDVQCAIENLMSSRAFSKFKKDEEYRFIIEKLVGYIYYNSEPQFDALYEKAECIAHGYLLEQGLIEDEDM